MGEMMLENAYMNAKDQIARGFKVWPAAFEPIWENIVLMVDHGIDIYTACRSGATEYSKAERIDIDEAFSSIVCAFGVGYRSMVWYEIMAMHYAKQAEKESLREDMMGE